MSNKFLKLSKKIASYVLTDKAYVRLNYLVELKKPLNLRNPKTYNEKLQWIKLYDHNPVYSTMVDKATAKDYVAGIIGDEYIIPTYAVYDSVEEIKWDELPAKFILKTTHDSGTYIICKDKKNFDIENAKTVLRKSLKNNYFRYGREWPYKNVKHRIIVEKFLKCDHPDEGLEDYKVMCFNGKAKLIEYHTGRISKNHKQDFYDTDWNILDIFQQGMPNTMKPIERPELLDKMIEKSEILAKNIPHVRVDWYLFEGRLYFGELTFFDGSGLEPFLPVKWNDIIGSWIELPDKKRK